MNNNRIMMVYMATIVTELRIGCRNRTQTNTIEGKSVLWGVCVCVCDHYKCNRSSKNGQTLCNL